MKQHTSLMIGLGLLIALTTATGAAGGDPLATKSPDKPQPEVGRSELGGDRPTDTTRAPGCATACDNCWCGGPFDNDCDSNWEDDGWCDCCCQFPDTDDCGGVGNCGAGEIEDCFGNCVPEWWLGDGECDQGQYGHNNIAIYLNCPALNCDNGDCTPAECTSGGSCPAGEIEDCNGNCVPESWIGDGYCDDGAYPWGGNLIHLDCWEFDCDAYDCSTAQCGGCPTGEIEDCNGHCAPGTWVGDGDCDQGQWSSHGVLIYFNCWEFGCDDRDCPMIECGECSVLGNEPPNCAIDARQPHALNNPAVRYGWNWVEFTFGCEIPPLGPGDFLLRQSPLPAPPPPQILFVNTNSAGELRIQLSGPINPGHWTCFDLVWPADPAPRTLGCLGYLPADVNSDGFAAPPDILRLIDCLNGAVVAGCEPWQCNTDRSGGCEPADILRVIDLLNGAGSFMPWLNHELPPCPMP